MMVLFSSPEAVVAVAEVEEAEAVAAARSSLKPTVVEAVVDAADRNSVSRTSLKATAMTTSKPAMSSLSPNASRRPKTCLLMTTTTRPSSDEANLKTSVKNTRTDLIGAARAELVVSLVSY
jgi:hypothetical protein